MRRSPALLALAALLVPLVAGCLQGPSGAATLDGAGEGDLRPFVGTYGLLTTDGGHGEPSFGEAPDGTLFANGPGGRGGAVYRSTDGGATWERLASPVDPMPNFDPDLAVDVDGTVWFDALWIGCTSVAVSRDLGESWTSNPLACNTPVSDRQYVIPTQGGEAYLYSHQLPTFYQMAAKTTDYGQTWIPTGLVETPDHHLLVDEGTGWGGGGFWNQATGSVYFTWTYSHGGALGSGGWNPGFALTRDGGDTWEMGEAASMGGRQLGLGLVVGAADAAGNAYLAWGEDHDGDVAIYLAASSDDGRTWRDPVRVDVGEGSNVFPAIAAGAPGKVAVAYYENVDAGNPSDVQGTWNVTLAWTDDALADSPAFQHANLTERPVKEGPICISGTTCDGGREFLDYFQIHALRDGRVGAIFNSMMEPEAEGRLVEVFVVTQDALLA